MIKSKNSICRSYPKGTTPGMEEVEQYKEQLPRLRASGAGQNQVKELFSLLVGLISSFAIVVVNAQSSIDFDAIHLETKPVAGNVSMIK